MRAASHYPPFSSRAKPMERGSPRSAAKSHPSGSNPTWHGLATRSGPQALHLQAKLKIGAPDDEYEREADHVADQVMRMAVPAAGP